MTKVLAWSSRVRPSGAARATAWVPMLPEAPGRFSTTKGWAKRAWRKGATSRARMSTPVPGVNGTRMVIGPSGLCARAMRGAPAARASATRLLRSTMLPTPAARRLRRPASTYCLGGIGATEMHAEGVPRLTRRVPHGDIAAIAIRWRNVAPCPCSPVWRAGFPFRPSRRRSSSSRSPTSWWRNAPRAWSAPCPRSNARPAEQFEEWVVEIQERLAAHDARHPGAPGRALRHQPHRPQVQRPAGARSGDLREAPGADHHHQPRRAAGGEPGGPLLWRLCAARRDQPAFRAQGGREGRGRAGAGRGGRGRACRLDLALRAGAGDPRLVRRAARPFGRHLARRVHPRGRGDGRRFRLYRQRLHRHHRSAGGRGAQADGRGARGRRHRLHQRSSPACTAIT